MLSYISKISPQRSFPYLTKPVRGQNLLPSLWCISRGRWGQMLTPSICCSSLSASSFFIIFLSPVLFFFYKCLRCLVLFHSFIKGTLSRGRQRICEKLPKRWKKKKIYKDFKKLIMKRGVLLSLTNPSIGRTRQVQGILLLNYSFNY